MTSEEIKKVLDSHQKWINEEDGGERANLRGADLDFSCFPLWCGGSKFQCDTKLVYQLLAHICTLDFPDDEGIKELIMPFAVKSHRAVDLGLREEAE